VGVGKAQVGTRMGRGQLGAAGPMARRIGWVQAQGGNGRVSTEKARTEIAPPGAPDLRKSQAGGAKSGP
jgi:hypothetical protein